MVYPITIIQDRYGGVYSGGQWTAWNLYPGVIPFQESSNDVICGTFWQVTNMIVGIGNTPDEALKDLIKKLK